MADGNGPSCLLTAGSVRSGYPEPWGTVACVILGGPCRSHSTGLLGAGEGHGSRRWVGRVSQNVEGVAEEPLY